MHLTCPDCHVELEYSKEPPKFCSNCGCQLHTAAAEVTATVGFTPSSQSGEAVRPPFKMPDKVSEYRMIRELGRGGMGVVYEAEQESTGRRVAVKLLLHQGQTSEDTVERFIQEGRVAASLSHPKSTFVYAAGEQDEQFFIVMELMPGGTLKDVVADGGQLPVNRAVDYILDVCDGLEAAHDSGVVHRDVKPSNCFLDQAGGVKVGDFGLSKSLIQDAALTRTGAFMGTPQFAAPEQIRGGRIDPRTDVYAVGATLYYLLAGEAPFTGDVAKVIAEIASEKAPRIDRKRKDVPKEIDQIIARMLAKDASDRPSSLNEVREALLPYASGSSSIADIGRRLAAHFLDTTGLGIVVGVATYIGFAIFEIYTGGSTPIGQLQTNPWFGVWVAGLLLAYFSLFEGFWGRGLGKWLTGLRVVDQGGSAPGVIRAFGRALFIPGIVLIVPQLLTAFTGGVSPEDLFQGSVADRMYVILAPQLMQGIGLLLSLACFATLRRENGYRGIHELLTGTRVVRVGASHRTQVDKVPVTVAQACEPWSKAPAEFELLGEMGVPQASSTTVYLAKDKLLNRNVWFMVRKASSFQLSESRKSLSRSTRLHWLQGGQAEGYDWNAFEAVRGLPFAEYMRTFHNVPWEYLRPRLIQVGKELKQAQLEGTLPDSLSQNHLWIDRAGNIRLLDVALDGEVSVTDEGDAESSKAATAESSGNDLAAEDVDRFFVDLLRLAGEGRSLPGVAQDFLQELGAANRKASIDELVEELEEQPPRKSSYSWDERLGILAVSFGTEFPLNSTIALLLALLLTVTTSLAAWPMFVVLLLVCTLLPVILGVVYGGGPVFRLTGVGVRRGQRAASGTRLAWRSFVAWFPAVVSNAAVSVWLMKFIIFGEIGSPDQMIQSPTALLLLSLWPLVGVLQLLGAIVAVAIPSRGIQDLLAGTYLVPR